MKNNKALYEAPMAKVIELKEKGIICGSETVNGTRSGYDVELIRMLADATGKSIVASGGAGTLEHFRDAVLSGHADTLLAASVFHFGTFTVRQVKTYLASQGIPVRP